MKLRKADAVTALTSFQRWLLVLVLLIAAALRLYGLNNLSPPGLAHDEVANWLIDRSILAGNHAIYFTEAYGHEAGFHYLQALFVALLGDNALALRLPAAFAGLLGVAVSYTLARRLFGREVGLIAAALLGVLFWPVFYSRLGLRAILLPLLTGLSAYFWWRGWGTEDSGRHSSGAGPVLADRGRSLRYMALAGLLAGLSLYSYMAARTVPIFYALFLGYLFLFHRPALRQRWRSILLFWLLFLIVTAPLLIFLLTHPGAEYRIAEVDAPLRALLQGNLRPVVDNSVDIVGMFGYRGDPLWRQNVAPQPVFDLLTAGFFYACLFLCLLRFRNSRYAFLFLWVLTAIIPSVVTKDAPSSIRIINILPVLTILPAIVMHSFVRLSTKNRQLSTGGVEKWIVSALLVGLVLFNVVRTARAIFVTWPANEEVQFVWQEALTDAAAYLNARPQVENVAVGGWSPHTMDPPTMALSLQREEVELRFFYPDEALIVPAVRTGPASYILRPAVLPLHPLLEAQLASWGVLPEEENSIVRYVVEQPPVVEPRFAMRQRFGDELLFLGYDVDEDCQAAISLPCQILTYWQVLETPAGPRRFFLHAVDSEGEMVANGDGLGAPAAYWRPGDLIVQRHELDLQQLSPYTVRLGVYDPQSDLRLHTEDGDDYLSLLEGSY